MNTILNNCKEIYPELFSAKNQNPRNYFAITKEQFSQCITQEFTNYERKNSNASSISTDTFEETTATTGRVIYNV